MTYHGRHRLEDTLSETTMLPLDYSELPVFTGELYDQPTSSRWRGYAIRALVWLGFLAVLGLLLIGFELTVG